MKFDIKNLASLARIRLTPAEEAALSTDLENILGYVEKINELKTDGIEPTSHVLNIENVYRDDTVVVDETSAEKVLKALPAAAKDGRFFRVPKVIEGIE